jgi:hypothetical protein
MTEGEIADAIDKAIAESALPEQPVGSAYHRGFNDGLTAAVNRESTTKRESGEVENCYKAIENLTIIANEKQDLIERLQKRVIAAYRIGYSDGEDKTPRANCDVVAEITHIEDGAPK